jgi:hypothetical protein
LWDYHSALLHRYLTLPKRRPAYRADRQHKDFLCKLQTHPFFHSTTASAAPASAPALSEAEALHQYLATQTYTERFEDAVVQALRSWFDVVDPTAAAATTAQATGEVDWAALERLRAEWVQQHTASIVTREHLKLTQVVDYEQLFANPPPN